MNLKHSHQNPDTRNHVDAYGLMFHAFFFFFKSAYTFVWIVIYVSHENCSKKGILRSNLLTTVAAVVSECSLSDLKDLQVVMWFCTEPQYHGKYEGQ